MTVILAIGIYLKYLLVLKRGSTVTCRLAVNGRKLCKKVVCYDVTEFK
jgi:hypothetical protein